MKSLIELGQIIHTSKNTFKSSPIQSPNPSVPHAQATKGQLLHSWDFSNVLPLCSQLRGWQTEVFNTLKRQDVYVAASPSAGKTLPYLCFWMRHLLIGSGVIQDEKRQSVYDYMQLLNNMLWHPKQIKKLLVLVPIRALAQQTTQEFRFMFSRILAKYLSHILNFVIDYKNLSPQEKDKATILSNRQYRDQILTAINPELIKIIRRKQDLYYGEQRLIKRQINNSTTNKQDLPNYLQDRRAMQEEANKLDELFYQSAQQGIKKIVQDLRGNYSFVAETTGLGMIGQPKTAPVVISIYESAPKAIAEAGGPDNFSMVVCDESHLIQQDLSPKAGDDRAQNITNNLYKVFKSFKGVNYRLLFLSGTANPSSAGNLSRYISDAFDKNVKLIVPPSTASNPSDVKIIADDSLHNIQNVLNILKHPPESSLIILFSKRLINDLAQKAVQGKTGVSLNQIEAGHHNQGYHHYKIAPRYSPINKDIRIDANQISNIANVASKMKEAANIHDTLLRTCVQNGFGYIYRLEDDAPQFNKRKEDNQIVARLFREKKIKVVLATDAVGIGLNITVKNMFIPTIMQPTGQGDKQQMDPSKLAQLLHRTGRGAFKVAKIITPSQYIPVISAAFSMAPAQFAQGVTIHKFTLDMLRTVNAFTNLWRAQCSNKSHK